MARILVADDDGSVRAAIRKVLVAAGHTVDEAGDGQAVLDLYAQAPRDLLLIDLYMPVIDGLETIIRLRTERPDVKIVAMSGGGFRHKHDVLAMARKAGACGTLAKPFEIEDLLLVVSRALGTGNAAPTPDPGGLAEPSASLGARSEASSTAVAVLVVDDDERARALLRHRLGLAGYAVVEAPDGERGLEVFRAGPTDVVIADLLLPGMSGPDLIAALRSKAPQVGVVAISGAPERLAALRGRSPDGGGFRTLLKPFTTEQLLEAVAAVVPQEPASRSPTARLQHGFRFLRRRKLR